MSEADAPDLPALGRALSARGVEFRRAPDVVQSTEAGDLLLQSFHDPDGHHLAIMGVVPR